MPLGWDPSYDADRHFNDMEESAAEEATFYNENRALIVQVVSAMLSNSNINMRLASLTAEEQSRMVTDAASIVRLIVSKGEYE